jgi:ABC-type multidrug transport system fused ATPase/permease subunit
MTVCIIIRVFHVVDTSKKSVVESNRAVPALPLYDFPSGLRQSLSLEIKGVTFVYATRPDQVVLKGISLNVTPGSMTAVCGR